MGIRPARAVYFKTVPATVTWCFVVTIRSSFDWVVASWADTTELATSSSKNAIAAIRRNDLLKVTDDLGEFIFDWPTTFSPASVNEKGQRSCKPIPVE